MKYIVKSMGYARSFELLKNIRENMIKMEKLRFNQDL